MTQQVITGEYTVMWRRDDSTSPAFHSTHFKSLKQPTKQKHENTTYYVFFNWINVCMHLQDYVNVKWPSHEASYQKNLWHHPAFVY